MTCPTFAQFYLLALIRKINVYQLYKTNLLKQFSGITVYKEVGLKQKILVFFFAFYCLLLYYTCNPTKNSMFKLKMFQITYQRIYFPFQDAPPLPLPTIQLELCKKQNNSIVSLYDLYFSRIESSSYTVQYSHTNQSELQC